MTRLLALLALTLGAMPSLALADETAPDDTAIASDAQPASEAEAGAEEIASPPSPEASVPAAAPDVAPAAPQPPQNDANPTRVKLGWAGLDIRDGKDRFGFELHGLMQGRVNWADPPDAEPSANAQLFRARLLLKLFAWDRRIMLFFQPEFVGGTRVLDARVDVTPVKGLTFAFGQMIVPFTRAWNTPLPLVEAPERSQLNTVLAPGRRFGGYVYGQPLDGEVELWAGAFEPDDPWVGARGDVHAPMAVARVQVNPLGKLPANELVASDGEAETRIGIGVAGLVSNGVDAAGVTRNEVTATADLGLQSHGFTTYGEGSYRWSDGGTQMWGASALVGHFILPKRLNLMGRFTAIDGSLGDSVGPRMTIEPMLGGYFAGPHLFAILRYSAAVGGGQSIGHGLTVHTQLMF